MFDMIWIISHKSSFQLYWLYVIDFYYQCFVFVCKGCTRDDRETVTAAVTAASVRHEKSNILLMT